LAQVCVFKRVVYFLPWIKKSTAYTYYQNDEDFRPHRCRQRPAGFTFWCPWLCCERSTPITRFLWKYCVEASVCRHCMRCFHLWPPIWIEEGWDVLRLLLGSWPCCCPRSPHCHKQSLQIGLHVWLSTLVMPRTRPSRELLHALLSSRWSTSLCLKCMLSSMWANRTGATTTGTRALAGTGATTGPSTADDDRVSSARTSVWGKQRK